MKASTSSWNERSIKELLDRDDKAVMRAIVRIYRNQTADEQSGAHTKHHNGIGFNSVDAPLLSSFAGQLLRGYGLTDRQMEKARPKIKRYWRQLLEIAKQHEAAHQPAPETVQQQLALH